MDPYTVGTVLEPILSGQLPGTVVAEGGGLDLAQAIGLDVMPISA